MNEILEDAGFTEEQIAALERVFAQRGHSHEIDDINGLEDELACLEDEAECQDDE